MAAGVPSLSIAVTKFQGQMTSVEFGAAYAFTEELKPGVVYNYRFSTSEIKKPIQEHCRLRMGLQRRGFRKIVIIQIRAEQCSALI